MLLGTQVWLQSRLSELRNEDGATAIEYGLLAALIAAVIIATVTLLGETLDEVFATVEEAIADIL